MNKYVWTIESSTYSDYSVDGVYSSKANAELVAAQLTAKYQDLDIVKRTLDPLVAEIREHHRPYTMTMAMDGTVEVCRLVVDPSTFDLDRGLRVDVWRRSAVTGVVWAKDEQHAVKIANEFRVQEIAK